MTTQEATQVQETAIEQLKRQVEDYDKHERELEEQERARENALPFNERTTWRKRHMYRGWQLEPVIEQHADAAGLSAFAITRSNYGYRVLNTPDLGIVDVDFDLGAGISKMHVHAQQKEAIANIRDWVAAHPEQSWRVYRTAAGLRMIRTDAPQPLDETYDAVRDAITEADRLYCDLCKEQNAFRARISPKVDRIGADYPGWSPYAYPEGFWDHSPTQEEILAYEMTARQYKVAELIEVVGSGAVHQQLGWTLRYHDDVCGVESALPMEQLLADDYIQLSAIAELVAFNDVYRPQGMAPDAVWDSLDNETRQNLRTLRRHRDEVIAACKRLDRLFTKWDSGAESYTDFDGSYQVAFAKYKEDAKRYVWVPSPGDVVYGYRTGGHWQSLEGSVFPHDPRYWQLENPTASATTSAVIRFLPSRDNQRYVQKQRSGVMKYYVSNILVVNDPRYPANNGKVFLFRYGHTIDQKITDMIAPAPQFDWPHVDVFDMKTGANFKLRACLIDGAVNLDKSSFDNSTPVGADAVVADLLTRMYSLDEA